MPPLAYHYKDSLISNLAYTKFEAVVSYIMASERLCRSILSLLSVQSASPQSPLDIPDDPRYEVLSYTSEVNDYINYILLFSV